MSYVFEIEHEIVWSPALQVGQLFVGFANAVSSVIGLENGLKAMASDYYEIDTQEFEIFVRSLLEGMQNPAYFELARGFVVTALVLLKRGGVQLNPQNSTQLQIFDECDRVSRRMPL